MGKKILITGRTGSGKTTLARSLAPLLGATVFDGDAVRASYPRQLGFSYLDRLAHARHMRMLCDAVVASGQNVIAAFICPFEEMREVFGADVTIYCSDPGDARYGSGDFDPPETPDFVCTKKQSAEIWARVIADKLLVRFRPQKFTALFVGRFQPFHAGHRALVVRGLEEYGQVALGVRETDPEWPFFRVKQFIDSALAAHAGRYVVLPLPNIVAVCYGRDVGYELRQYSLPRELEAISATEIRNALR